MRRRVLLVVLAAALVVTAMGCGKKPSAKAQAPLLSPPTVKQAGTLLVGVDLSYPPFAGEDKGQKVGIDVDVASALAERLGLNVKLVEVKPSDAATALANGTADVVMSVGLDQTTGGKIAYAGSYISDGPVLFARITSGSVEPSLTVDRLTGTSVAAQDGSPAFWYLRDQLGEQYVKGYSTLAEPLQKLSDGSLKLVGGDAVVGAYIARDLSGVRMVGQLKPAGLVGIGVAPDNTKLQDAVRSKLDALTADGVIQTIRAKWVADLPKLKLAAGASETSSVSAP